MDDRDDEDESLKPDGGPSEDASSHTQSRDGLVVCTGMQTVFCSLFVVTRSFLHLAYGYILAISSCVDRAKSMHSLMQARAIFAPAMDANNLERGYLRLHQLFCQCGE